MTAAVPTTMTAAGTASSHPGASGVAAVAATRTGGATEDSGGPLAPKMIAAVQHIIIATHGISHNLSVHCMFV